ncbi:unnamed protein product [Arabis nemorensis]|uniref:F-box domain-containing protein n=1 Tax=Arabis nemorensis TaxID=586526 RepID=A0A565ASC0_9BRAS|nr:unnamed protein product [Arabis nemorensis]
MKLRLRHHETRETLKLEFADTGTLHDLRRRINSSEPFSVHLSLNRKDELLSPSPEDTLRSLGVTSGDLIYYSLDHSSFAAPAQEIGLASSSGEANQGLVPTDDGKLEGPESERKFVHDSMGIGFAEADVVVSDQAKADLNPDPAEGSTEITEGPETMDVEELDVEIAAAGRKRLSEPFFLKNILLEKSGDTSELTLLAMSVHAVMLESGFLLLDPGSDKFSFSNELLSVSLSYTLPELVTHVESVTVQFQSLGRVVVVYGSLSGSNQRVPWVYLDKDKFVDVIESVMDNLKFEKQGTSSYYRDVFVFWRMVKDGLAIPLLIRLCDKAGLEPPPCLMLLPTELKLKILESLPGTSVAKMACLCTEMRYLASDNDLWKQKCLKEAKNIVVTEAGESVNWKEKFATFWRHRVRHVPIRTSSIRFPRRDPFPMFNGDHFRGPIGIHPGQPARGLGGRRWGCRRCHHGGLNFCPRCNHGE